MPLPFNITPSSVISDVILGLNLLTGTLNSDAVSVLDQASFVQVFQEARPLRVRPREQAQIMKHPAETGVTLADHRVIEPRRIEMLIMVSSQDYAGAFQQIRTAWQTSQLLIVQTKACVYQNMIISALPREEDPEHFDTTTVSLQMEEIIFALPGGTSSESSVQYYSPIDPTNQSTVLRGLQNSVIVPGSALLSAIHAASVWGF